MTEFEPSAKSVTSVSVQLPGGAPGPFDYLDGGLQLTRGEIVRVPLGRRETLGVVWGPGSQSFDTSRMKPVAGRYDAPPLPETLCAFLDFMAGYVMARPGAVIALALRARAALNPPPQAELLRLTEAPGMKLTAQRRKVLDADAAAPGLARSVAEWAELAGVSAATVKSMAAAGAFETVRVARDRPPPAPDPDFAPVALNEAQAEAARTLTGMIGQGFSAALLDGVTGSGKTETYFEAVAEALRQGQQVLILLPEIALTQSFRDRFEARFGVLPAEWHSDLTARTRAAVWRQAASGEARVVAGARSALFLPFRALGLIVLDEEHDSAFKQEEGVVYNARDMAVARARFAAAPVILASATPSLESWVNAQTGRYRYVRLPARFGAAQLPAMQLIDLRRDRPKTGRFLSPPLEQAIEETLARKEQALLFLNRRGYAPLNICQACGFRIECPDCSSWLVEHRFRGKLVCHHCGYERQKPKTCSACGAEDQIAASGPGIERIAEEVAQLWPEARVALASSDLFHGPASAQAALDAMAEGGVDILIGTQLVAKGHHFPNLTLAGVIDADLGLAGGDPRARERTFQLLHQVAGRSGRAGKPGRVLLQTHLPEDRLMQALAAHDRDAFLAAEMAERERLQFPPYGRFAALILSSEDEAGLNAFARTLARAAPTAEGVSVWGPAPALMARIRGRSRVRFLIKAPKSFRMQAYLSEWLSAVPAPPKVRLSIDIDPQSFL